MDTNSNRKSKDRNTKPYQGKPYQRTTVLTTDRRTYERVAGMRPGSSVRVVSVNDIVSTTRGLGSVEHDMLRRSQLLRRQYAGGFEKVKVRTDSYGPVACRLISVLPSDDDACSFTVVVQRAADVAV